MMAPAAKHMARRLALAIDSEMTVVDLTARLPFDHPTLEEGLRTACLDALGRLALSAAPLPNGLCSGPGG